MCACVLSLHHTHTHVHIRALMSQNVNGRYCILCDNNLASKHIVLLTFLVV